MERTLFNKNGDVVAYITEDYHETIYLWDGFPVAYLYEERHVYGINGRHLGWFIDNIIFNHNGERIGFTSNSCPVNVAKEPIKPKKYPMDEIRPRWEVPTLPKLDFHFADQDLADLLKEGQVIWYSEEEPIQESEEPQE
ncbi:4-fold beta flower protein [Thermodesulfobacteriota bacterium]